MNERKEFELTTAQFDELLAACRPVLAIALQCGPITSPQENANRAWCSLGNRLGFDGMTVQPSPKGQRFFTAIVAGGGPTERQPERLCCNPDGSCCDFVCGN